jgi:dTDP-4-amino-4,6-dideoxygalactose transaminase
MTDSLQVAFVDLSRGASLRREELLAAVARVVDSGRFVLGGEVAGFEQEFALASGAAHAVGVASGTDAIELALRVLDIGTGDEVVTQANTCVPTVAAVVRAGATPVLCDVEPDAGTMDSESLARAIGPKTRAVIPVHLYGQCADLEAISGVAAEHGTVVIEDCAQAHGARYQDRLAGTVGLMGCFSFYPTKNLGALGDAGAVITDDQELADRLRRRRIYGQTDRYRHAEAGINSRLDEIQAGILRAKLTHLEEWNQRRTAIAAEYTAALRDAPAEPLTVFADRWHVFHLYVIRVHNRPRFQSEMKRRGIDTLIHYPVPIHRQAPYRHLAAGPSSLRHSEYLAERVVSLPLYPELTDAEVEVVVKAARSSAIAAG